AVQLVYFQIQAARHQAVTKQQDIQLDIVDGQYWCIGITDQATCDCQSPQSCTIDGVEKVTSYDEFRYTQMAASTFAHNNQSRFSPPRGLAQGYAGSVTLTNTEQDFKVIVSNSGRVRICALAQAIPPYPRC
ncbi:MAG: GspH/FimT family protein, partial [Pseudomonadota bacterium]|nr:GspH/FimT family protein [Pseudomonadota bacterium]